MTLVESNVASSSGVGSSKGPKTCAWISLTLEEQLTMFNRTLGEMGPLFYGKGNESIPLVVKEMRNDPFVDIGSLIPHSVDKQRVFQGATPLHCAVMMGDRAMVNYILTSKKVDINANMSNTGGTALNIAMIGGKHAIVEDLLEHRADVSVSKIWGKSALYYMVQHKNSMLGPFKRLLANNVNIYDEEKKTTLHYAVKDEAIDLVKYLLNEKADANVRDKDGWTPLHYAVRNKSLNVVKCLLQQNADVNVVDEDGKSPLHMAIEEKAIDLVTYLLNEKADANVRDQDGWTPLHYAVRNKSLNVVKCLLQQNADVNVVDEDGKSPLHMAIEEKAIDLVTYLLNEKADANVLDQDGWTPLHYAVRNGSLNVVKCLLQQNADVNVVDEDGKSPLHIAAKNGVTNIISFLVEHNANLEALDYIGWSPLLYSIRFCNNEAFNRLIALGANVYVMDKDGNNALHFAIAAFKEDNMDTIKVLQECDVDAKNANAKNSTGYSPFFMAVAKGQTEMVQELLQNKEKIKLMQECNGQTAIQIACDYGYEHIKRTLMECNDVSQYVGDLYRDRQVYVDAANAILVGAALIASVTFASWLQPPLGYTTSYLDLAPSSSDTNYVDVQDNVSLRAFWVFNTLSFYFAIATVVFGARSVLPRRRMFIKTIVVKLHQNLLVTSIFLACSVFCVIIAFGIAGCIVLTPILKFQWYMIVPTIFGGLLCLVSLGFLFKSMLEDNLEKKRKTSPLLFPSFSNNTLRK